MILSVPSVFQTNIQHSIFRDLRSQLSLVKEGLGTSPVSRAAPTKAQKEDKDSSGTVRSREAHGTMAALFPRHRKLGHAGSRDRCCVASAS